MRVVDRPCVALTMAALWAVAVEALDYKRYDGVHRVEKRAPQPQITKGPILERRDDNVCGTSEKLCPSSLDGGCCPEDYDCAKESCYATTKGPSTCGTKVGWYNCDAVYGNGCCPDGYICETAGQCIPPTGSAYTFGCPASHFLCPASLSYGCCPNGMACATNQCYSTKPVTKTETVVITTTEDGSRTTYRTTRVTVSTPDEPTANIVNSDGGGEQAIFKYFPTAIPKSSPTSDADDDNGGGGLSTGVLIGIIVGSVAFLIIVLVTAFIIIRHLNKVVAAVTTSKQSEGSKSRPTMKEFKPTDSEIDALSVDPLMLPRPSAPGPDSSHPSPYNLASPDLSSNDHTPSAGYHAVSGSNGNSRHTSFDAGNEDYFHNAGNRVSQHSGVSAPTTHRVSNDSHGAYTHVRNWSNASDGSDGGGAPTWNQLTISELEARPRVPELPLSPSNVVFARDERRRSSGGTAASTTRPSVTSPRQRNRSESFGQSPLGVVDEEMHGFYGPASHLVGQTESHRPGTKGGGEGGKEENNGSRNEDQEGRI
ncbi:hypothetical protein B0T10DRAFT_454500 [Thelonectria olida]|uniref:Uncharacterized protein n=1 Tax=Thelonectria olida TaxID=1576542 RepID=A0A9P8WCP6_9HYPO|nr:hypothetical protein B0T10DRAFT_454500 [Thelonectria olida]